MGSYATTKLSSKGQVVIPEDVRETLQLKEGDQFVVIGRGDTVIFKMIAAPSLDDLGPLLEEAATQAKKVGLRPADVKSAIRRARRKR